MQNSALIMFIKISNLNDATHELFYAGKIQEIGLNSPFCDDYKLKIDLSKSHLQVIIVAELELKAKLNCDRCQFDFIGNIEQKFEHVYILGNKLSELDDDDLNISYLSADADKINISKEIIDYSNLAIPIKILCKEDCKGLCYQCGINLNEKICNCSDEKKDYRWNVLLELKNKLSN